MTLELAPPDNVRPIVLCGMLVGISVNNQLLQSTVVDDGQLHSDGQDSTNACICMTLELEPLTLSGPLVLCGMLVGISVNLFT